MEHETARLSLIDATHANAMHACAQYDFPEHPDDATREEISRLSSPSYETRRVGDGLSLTLLANSVLLIEIGENK